MSSRVGFMFNLVLLLVATVIGATFPKIGSILGYVGGFVGLGLIYIIPISVYLKRYKLSLTDPQLVQALDENRIKTVDDDLNFTSPKFGVEGIAERRTNLLNKTNDYSDLSLRESLLTDKRKPASVDYSKFILV